MEHHHTYNPNFERLLACVRSSKPTNKNQRFPEGKYTEVIKHFIQIQSS